MSFELSLKTQENDGKHNEIVQIARKLAQEFWQNTKLQQRDHVWRKYKMKKRVKNERKRRPFILFEDPHLPSNYLLPLL